MRHTILIVDDDALIRRLFESAFSGTCRLFAAAEGQAALELLKTEKPDLMFLDIDMPGLSGLEVLRQLKKSDLKLAIWMLTGNEKLEVITEAMELGASGYLTKPFEIGRVREILNSALMPAGGKPSDKPWVVKRRDNSLKPGKVEKKSAL